MNGPSIDPATRAPALAFTAMGLACGDCRIDVDAGELDPATASAFSRALRLARAEPLCAALERWLGGAFDLEPRTADGDAAAVSEGTTLALRLSLREGDAPTLTLHLPIASLGALPAVPESVSSVARIDFEPLAAGLRVARVSLPEPALGGLTEGAALLLPESFGKRWPVQLDTPGGRLVARLELADGPAVVLEGAGFSSDEVVRAPSISGGGGPMHRVDVLLDGTLAIDPGAVLAGGAYRVPLPETLPDCPFRLTIDRRARLVGHLAPLGDGHGFVALAASDG